MRDIQSRLQMESTPSMKRNNQNITLRNTRRIYKKWGLKYLTAVKDAVFKMNLVPFVPLKTPASLKCENEESNLVYVCQQCQDCFWFKSSFEDHSHRHSWILGFWCQKCFSTVCTHVPNSSTPCDLCINLEHQKRSYMKKKGIHKHQKMGTVRVFYNQCQFFAHLKMHNISFVNICDIMLMPLPNVEGDWTSKMEFACEALLEYCFMIRVHIMDWLRAKKVNCNWWKLVESNIDDDGDDNPITKIIKTYNGRNLFHLDIAKVDADLIPLNSLPKVNLKSSTSGLSKIGSEKNEKDYNKNISNVSTVTTVSPVFSQNTLEDKDNPCTPTDITFVNCGPTYNCYAYDSLIDYSSHNSKMINSKYVQHMNKNKQSTVMKKQSKQKRSKKETLDCITPISSSSNKSSNLNVKDFSNQNLEKDFSRMQKDLVYKCDNSGKLSTIAITTQNGIDNLIMNSISKNTNLLPNLSNKEIINQEYEKQKHLSIIANDSNSLTFQGTDSVKMNALITQIPSHLLLNNKIVFVGQDMDGVNKNVNHVTFDANFNEKDNKSASKKLIPLHIHNSAILEDDKSSDNLQKLTDESNKTKSPYRVSVEGTIVYRNGRRYILKKTSNGIYQLSMPTSPDSLNNLQVVQYDTNNQNGITKLSLFENTYFNLPETNVSLPTPSPSSSELSNSSSCEIQKKQNSGIQKESETSRHYLKPKLKQSILDLLNNDVLCDVLSFRRAENAEVYLNTKRTKSSTKQLNIVTTVTIPNCRQNMLKEFRQLNCPELMERIRHLQNVRKEILSVMNFVDNKDTENTLKSILTIQIALEDALESCNHESEDIKDVWNNEEILSNDWESKCQFVNNFRCATCSKIMKPKTYIPGFSKPAENDVVYCSCYKHFCQECRSYQGNVTRFLSHQNFHDEEKPYTCPDCFRRFPSFRLLEGHTWSLCFHMLKKRVFCCKICQIDGFQDTESIARHFAIMHSSKKIACETCNMVLDTYNEYKRHRDEMHSTMLKSEPIRLMICKLGQCINRYEKYMMHLEKHYGVRKIIWLKCPFCPYYNLESKQFLIQFKIHFQIVHLYRLIEIIKPETLKDILPTSLYECLFKEDEPLIYDNERSRKFRNFGGNVCSDTIIPKIINTRTIASEDFEQVSNNNEDSGSIQLTIKDKMEGDVWPTISNKMSNFKITDVRLNNTDCSIANLNNDKKDNLPKILNVRSMANVLPKDQKCLSDIANIKEDSVESEEIQSNDQTKKHKSIVNDQPKETYNSAKESIKSDAKCVTNDKIISKDKEINDVQNIATKLIESSSKTSEILTKIDSKLNVVEKINNTFSALTETPNEIKISDDVNSMSVIKSESLTTLPTSNDTDNKMNEDINNLPKPPPLIKIPQYILENKNKQEDKKTKKTSHTISHTSGNRKTNPKRPLRIAFNGPTNSKDMYQDYKCHLCGELINTAWPIISIHFNTRHSEECKLSVVTPRLLRITPEFINGGYKELLNNKKRKSEGTVPISKKKRRWSAKKYADSNNSFGLGLCVEQESIEDGEGNFICRKCNQRCANMSDLREHIASNHRIKGRYLVCLECGENFVVAPSLQMHLKAFHGIQDPIFYMNQNSSYAPSNTDELENETKAMIANQCYVCMAVFEDKATVDKHLRVHGMAFLNRKRIEAQNALKSPEKNIKVNDEKQSFQKESTKEVVKRDNPSNTILEKINATIIEAAQ